MELTFLIDNENETVYLNEADLAGIKKMIKEAPIMALHALKGVDEHVTDLMREADEAVAEAISAFDVDNEGGDDA